MKLVLLIISTLLIAGCVSTGGPVQLTMETTDTAPNGIHRFENSEVLCYIYRDTDNSTMQCKWK